MIDERRRETMRSGADDSEPIEYSTPDRTSENRIADAYLHAALEGDRVEALRIIREDGVTAGLSIGQLYLGVIQATQYRVGKLWEDGEISISQEHLATGISQLAIAQVYSMMQRGNAGGHRVLITCVPGETHDMGPRILADFYEMAGFEVRNLGADVPVRDIVFEVKKSRPNLVALSATMSYNLPAFRETVHALRAEIGEHILIAAGGQAFQLTPELLDELDVPIRATDARQLVDQSRQALGIS
jgi:MerR family transcriptional regulator, light-induced transcriptional regulator